MLISWLGAVAAAAIAVGLFLPYRSSPFLYDDKFAILDNPIVTGSGPAVDAWTVDFWGHHRVDSPLSHKSFRPLITLWLRSDFRAWGASPANFSTRPSSVAAAGWSEPRRSAVACSSPDEQRSLSPLVPLSRCSQTPRARVWSPALASGLRQLKTQNSKLKTQYPSS